MKRATTAFFIDCGPRVKPERGPQLLVFGDCGPRAKPDRGPQLFSFDDCGPHAKQERGPQLLIFDDCGPRAKLERGPQLLIFDDSGPQASSISYNPKDAAVKSMIFCAFSRFSASQNMRSSGSVPEKRMIIQPPPAKRNLTPSM